MLLNLLITDSKSRGPPESPFSRCCLYKDTAILPCSSVLRNWRKKYSSTWSSEEKALKKKSTARVFYEIAETLKYVLNKGVLHNDLKTNNVLMQQDTSDGEIHPIFIDFGKSRSIAKAKAYKRGDVDYLAPEVKVGKKESKQSDIFSFGKMLEAAVRGRSFLPIFSQLIARTTALDPSDRPSAGEISHELAKFLDEY